MVWALVAAFFALFGIIHMPAAGFQNFAQPTMEQCDAASGQCWDYAEQWMYFTAYLMMAATFVLIYLAKVYGGDKTIEDQLDDKSSHAFDDWFHNAAIDITVHDTSPIGKREERMLQENNYKERILPNADDFKKERPLPDDTEKYSKESDDDIVDC